VTKGQARYRIRPRTCVLCGAIIGLVAAGAVHGVLSAPAIAAQKRFKRANLALTAALARPAACAPAQTLRDGVCIVHVLRVPDPVVVASPVVLAGPDPAKHDDDSAEPANAGRG